MDNSKLVQEGFAGNIEWTHNEEGSGAKFYGCSLYFPDSLTDPKTNSGITIDTGIDIGNCNRAMAKEVLNIYFNSGLLSKPQISLINTCLGLKRKAAAAWLQAYRSHFNKTFLVPDSTAIYVLANYTAPDYWSPLVEASPELLTIQEPAMKSAVHTALLSHAFNRGYSDAIQISQGFLRNSDFIGLAKAIRAVPSRIKALQERRVREANLIISAQAQRETFNYTFEDLNPMPLMVIPGFALDNVVDALNKQFLLNIPVGV